jgi:Type II secretion system (T2SS), protein G
MNRAFQLLLLLALVTGPGCGGARLSHSEIRKQVADLGTSTLVPSAVSVRRIVNQSDKRLIAETTVDLAFQFERDSTASPWHIASVRLGDQNWVSVPELIEALNESKRKLTAVSFEKLGAGIAAYRQRNGSAPAAGDIKALSDVLHPQYMKDLVLEDGWGRLIEVESSGSGLRLRSAGVDGQRGTPDDIVSP